jgi:hypothetical protein
MLRMPPFTARYYLKIGSAAPPIDGLEQLHPSITLPGDDPNHYYADTPEKASAVASEWMANQVRAINLAHSLISTSDDPAHRPLVDAVLLGFQDGVAKFGNSTLDWMQGVCHSIENCALLDDPGIGRGGQTHAPALAIGAGPSLSQYLDDIRRCQHQCLIVSCDAAEPVLRAAGIAADLITPVERVLEVAVIMRRISRETCLAGSPVLLPSIVKSFPRRLRVTPPDPIYRWWNQVQDDRVPLGRSTGTAAVGVAAQMTYGPVYLIGHDLSYGADGASHAEGTDRLCQQGEAGAIHFAGHRTRPEWVQFARDISAVAMVAEGRVMRVGSGLPIAGVKQTAFPTIGSADKQIDWPIGQQGNAAKFRVRMRQALDQIKARPRGGTHVEAMVGPEHQMLIAGMLRPLFLSASIGARMGIPHATAPKVIDQVLDQCVGYMEASLRRAEG